MPEPEITPGGSEILRHGAAQSPRYGFSERSTLDYIAKREAIYVELFGADAMVYDDALPGMLPHIDVYVHRPGFCRRDFHTLVTGGMSDLRMKLPAGAPPDMPSRVELVFYLPADREPNALYADFLRTTARFPYDYNTWDYYPESRRGSPTVVTYAVGLGRDDWRTPTGRFTVTEKAVNPVWVAPASIRAEHIRDRGYSRRSIAGGHPSNPLGHHRMRLSLPLLGIHGTNVPWGVGMQVSHGCVRLYPEDIKPLFAIVPVGTPGEFVYQPVKFGAREGDIYVQVHADIYETGFGFVRSARSQLRRNRWSELVDWATLTAALQSKSGVPTRISEGNPLHRRAEEPAAEPRRPVDSRQSKRD